MRKKMQGGPGSKLCINHGSKLWNYDRGESAICGVSLLAKEKMLPS